MWTPIRAVLVAAPLGLCGLAFQADSPGEDRVPSKGSPLPPEAASVEALFDADRAFAAAAAEDRLEGWVSWFDARGVRLPLAGDFAQGHEAIRRFDAGLWANPEIELRWEPEVGGLVAEGELGFTRGRYELVGLTAGEPLATGTYFSIWRWTAEGWKVALDGGVPDP